MRLADQVEVHSLAAGSVFLFGYEVAVVISRQVSMFFSISGGLLLGQWLGTFYSVIGANLGMAILLTIANLRLAIRSVCRRSRGSIVWKWGLGKMPLAICWSCE